MGKVGSEVQVKTKSLPAKLIVYQLQPLARNKEEF
jgi:hypothetical protein